MKVNTEIEDVLNPPMISLFKNEDSESKEKGQFLKPTLDDTMPHNKIKVSTNVSHVETSTGRHTTGLEIATTDLKNNKISENTSDPKQQSCHEETKFDASNLSHKYIL